MIRAYQADDVDQIEALILPIQQTEFEIDISFQDQPDLSDIAGFYQHGVGEFWVMETDGRIVGSIALLDIGNQQAALRKMFVLSSYRGREKGVAKALLDHVITHARQQSVESIFLGTTEAFKAAHRFYEKNGFAACDILELPEAFPRMAVDTKFYRLSL